MMGMYEAAVQDVRKDCADIVVSVAKRYGLDPFLLGAFAFDSGKLMKEAIEKSSDKRLNIPTNCVGSSCSFS